MSKKKGFTQMPHWLEDKLISYRGMSPDERGVFDLIVKYTIGWDRKKDRIALTRFEDLTGMKRSHVCRSLKNLALKRVIFIEKNGDRGKCNIYSINPNTEEWIKKVSAITRLGNSLNRQLQLPVQVITITSSGNNNYQCGDSSNNTLPNNTFFNNTLSNNPSENSSGSNEKKDMIDNTKYSEDFLTAYSIYPKRNHIHNKASAYKQWRARLKAGATAEEMMYGIVGYQKYCTQERIIGTKFVKTMCVFLGESLHFGDYINYKPETSNATDQQNNKKSTTAERTESFARVRSKAMSDGLEQLAEATRNAEEARRAYEEARRACGEEEGKSVYDSDA